MIGLTEKTLLFYKIKLLTAVSGNRQIIENKYELIF